MHRFGFLLSVVLATGAVTSFAQDGARRPAVRVDPISTIIDAFASYPVVALGEGAHGNVQGHAFRLALFDDARIDLWQPWLDTYELEPYLLYKAVMTGKRVREVPITIVYHARGTTKMKPFRDWWRIARPLVFLSLGLRK